MVSQGTYETRIYYTHTLKYQFYYKIWDREHYFYINTQIYHGAKARVFMTF